MLTTIPPTLSRFLDALEARSGDVSSSTTLPLEVGGKDMLVNNDSVAQW